MSRIDIKNSNVYSPSIGFYSQTAASTPIVNTTVASTLINGGVGTLTVPANGFSVGDAFIAYFSGIVSSRNNDTITITVKSSGVTLASTGVITMPATTNKNYEIYINFAIRSLGAAGVAAIATSGSFTFNKNASNSPDSIGFSLVNSTTFDTTIANTLNVLAQWGTANPGNSIETEIFNLYKIY